MLLMNMEAVGLFLRGIRKGQGLSTAEVAAGMKQLLGRNVDSTTVWRIESARMDAGSDLLLAMLAVLGVDAMSGVVTAFKDGNASPVLAEESGRLYEMYSRLPPDERAEAERNLRERLRQLEG